MQITISRPLAEDRAWLESTWHHVSEADGVRLQLNELLEPAQTYHRNNWGHDLIFRFVEQRRVVKGTFHPGRKVLPASAITYELVYDCGVPPAAELNDELLLDRIQSLFAARRITGKVQSGNVTATNTEEEEQ